MFRDQYPDIEQALSYGTYSERKPFPIDVLQLEELHARGNEEFDTTYRQSLLVNRCCRCLLLIRGGSGLLKPALYIGGMGSDGSLSASFVES